MGVIEPFREIHNQYTNGISFTPKAGRAAIVHDILCCSDNAGWATVRSANTTVGFFEIGPKVRNHLEMAPSDDQIKSVLQDLAQHNLPCSFPVPEGEVFSISTDVEYSFLIVHFSEVDPGDIKPDMPNAKQATEMLRIFYGTNSADITSSTWQRLDKSLNPSEMHNWPFEEIPCPFDILELHAIGALSYEENTYTGSADVYGSTKALRVWRGTELLFHPNEDGFVTLGGGAVSGSANVHYGDGRNQIPYTGGNEQGNLFYFPEPVIFKRGEEMRVDVQYDIDANAKVTANATRCALFCVVKKGAK